MTPDREPPTLYDWAGGKDALERLTEAFYRRVLDDDLLHPLFQGMDAQHPRYVAAWFAEVFGGPPAYTEMRGGYPNMLSKHRNLAITPAHGLRRMGNPVGDGQFTTGLPPPGAGAGASVGMG